MVSRSALSRDRARTSYRASVPAPTGGWNTRDDIGNMPAADAEVLDNLIPDVATVKPRKGYIEFVSGVGSGNVDTITKFVTSSGAKKFIAAGGGSIYDITTAVAVSLGSGYGSDLWDTAAFNNHLIFVNGADDPQDYDGSAISNASFVGSISPDRFFAAHVFKNRVFYAATDELAFWYTELFASTGIITKFPLAGIAEGGGSVVSINSWTVDGGNGPDDFLAVFTSEGEVLVYQGTDPGLDFAIVGRFNVGGILDNRAVTSIFGKLFVVTERDYVYLPDIFITKGSGKDTKLSGAARSAISSYRKLPGWAAHYSAIEGLMIVNVPITNSTAEQHVISVKTGAACRFTGINARSWTEFGGSLYFGSNNGKVYKYGGTTDDGASISVSAKTAPSILRSNSEKTVKAYRSVLKSAGDIALVSGLGYDFNPIAFTQSLTLSADTQTLLPQSWPWVWPASDIDRSEWQKAVGRGTFVQYYMQANVTAEFDWIRNDYIPESGGILR